MWVLSQKALGRLEQFHARCAHYITRRHIRRLPDSTWLYLSLFEEYGDGVFLFEWRFEHCVVVVVVFI
jgi:hypothetical protein